MSDPPHFPAPGKTGYREPAFVDVPDAQTPAPAPALSIVVTRADAPPESADLAPDAPGPKQLSLSKDEIKALLAVEGAHHQAAWRKAAKRGAVIVIPTGILSTIAQSVFGWWGAIVFIVIALVWAARPMWKQDREGWS